MSDERQHEAGDEDKQADDEAGGAKAFHRGEIPDVARSEPMEPYCKACEDRGCWLCGTYQANRMRLLTKEGVGEENLTGFLKSIGWKGGLEPSESEMVLAAIRWGIQQERSRRLVEAQESLDFERPMRRFEGLEVL